MINNYKRKEELIMKKNVILLGLTIAMSTVLASCGETQQTENTPISLDGTWVQVDAEESYHKAEIKDGTIEINWVFEEDNTEALYWAGSCETPTEGDTFTWDSVNDTEKTSTALMASPDETKTFTYEDGKISYEASAMGVTKTIELERQTETE